jgi:hypothetical protein
MVWVFTLNDRELIGDIFNRFTDGSGRSNYYARYTFMKVTPKK